MTNEKIIRLLKSSVEEDKIIVGNYMVKNMTLSDIKKIFDEYGDSKYNLTDWTEEYISGKFIKSQEMCKSPALYIRTPEYLLFISNESWLLQPSYGIGFSDNILKNVEI